MSESEIGILVDNMVSHMSARMRMVINEWCSEKESWVEGMQPACGYFIYVSRVATVTSNQKTCLGSWDGT